MSKNQQISFLEDEALLSRLKHCTQLPSPPAVASRIIELGQDPNASMGDVADAVSIDPALSAKIIRLANAPLYARHRKTDNLRQAITMFGLNGTLTLALSFSLVSTLRSESAAGLDYNHYWRRSLAAATCASTLSRLLNLKAGETLFLAGLLQDIGILALDKLVPDLYQNIGHEQKNHQAMLAMERDRLGADHAAVGAWLLQQWHLPEWLLSTIANSHAVSVSDADAEEEQLTKCIALSGAVADIWCSEEPERQTHEAARLAEDLLQINQDVFSQLLDLFAAELPEVARLFEINMGDPGVIESLLEQAKEILMLRNLSGIQEAEKLHKTTESLQLKTQELEEASRRDGLTKLYNRRHLDWVLAEEIAQANKYEWPLSVAFIDLDHFKQINDTYGHQAGDQVLQAAAGLLIANTRDTDVVARYGGEEFVVVLPGTREKGARITAERIVKAFAKAKHRVGQDNEIVATVSVGLVTQNEAVNYQGVEELLAAADRAVYSAKRGGRNRLVIANDIAEGKGNDQQRICV